MKAALLVCLVSFACAQAQSGQRVGLLETTIERRTRIQYLVQLPRAYDAHANASWPLLVYLHGGSARGSDIDMVTRYGPPLVAARLSDSKFVLVTPQCPEGEIWTDTEGLMAMIACVQREYRIDARRIYLTGISMGGRGVLYLAYRYPKTFAAVAALAPYSPITAWGKELSSTPILIVHGQKDTAAPIADSKDLAEAITRAKGDIELRILPQRDHSLADLYEGSAVYDWLLKHQRYRR